MGMELVEFSMAVEDAFGIYIPPAEAATLETPGKLVEYIETRVGQGIPIKCLEQRAFYKLRQAGMQVLGLPRETFKPDSLWVDLLLLDHHDRQWQLLQTVSGIRPWPRLKPHFAWGPSKQTVGQTARTVSIIAVASLLTPNEALNQDGIEKIVRGLMAEELGITSFRWTDRFVQDLGLS